jgi:Icc protein
MQSPFRIVQLSDTHFLKDDALAEGGEGAYDTDAAFDAVFTHIAANHDPQMVVVTGDIADNGFTDEYRKAAEAFSRFDVPVNVCPGNHDHFGHYSARIGRPGVSTSRVIEIDTWAHVFVDSAAGTLLPQASGTVADPPPPVRLNSNGVLGARETAWIRETCDTIAAEHVFIWLHHPPAAPLGLTEDAAYEAEWRALLSELPQVRGFGGGHTHVPDDYEIDGCPVAVAPSLKNNFSMAPQTWLPPGYRSYEFNANGSWSSDVHLVDDERWPRRPFGSLLASLFRGDISHGELRQIIERRNAERTAN